MGGWRRAILQEASGLDEDIIPAATSKVSVGGAIKAHQNVQCSASVPANLLRQAMQDAALCMQLSDGSVPAPSLIALALLWSSGSPSAKQSYNLLLVPKGMEVGPSNNLNSTQLQYHPQPAGQLASLRKRGNEMQNETSPKSYRVACSDHFSGLSSVRMAADSVEW
jgi:hypothetical protein